MSNFVLGMSMVYIVVATISTKENFKQYRVLSKVREYNDKRIKELESALGYN